MSNNYKPKKFYIDFKRKHRKNPGFDVDLGDKDKERLYREYASIMKKSAEERSQEFTKLLEVNRSKASLTGLSTTFTSDPRYHAISAETR
ncbi:hypothetical protein AAULH_14051, partial [Lactobacillus helveticus MTCC 5463]